MEPVLQEWRAAEIIFWMATALLLYTYLGYPLLLAVLALFRRRQPPVASRCPSVSVLTSCYNEEASIERKIRETLNLDYPPDKLEVVVVSDGSTDRTEETVRSIRDPRVRLVSLGQRRGKTNAQNVGVQHCRGEIIVFSDATTTYDPKALRYLVARYEDPQVGAVSGQLQYCESTKDSPTNAGNIAFWSYENMIKRLQSQIDTLTGCSGCIYSVRKEIYEPLEDRACSDLVEPLVLVRRGYRVAFEPLALAYEAATESIRDEFRMRIRVVTHGILSVFQMRELLRFWTYGWKSVQLLSHKVLRWCVPILLIVILVSSAALMDNPFFRYVFWLQVALYGFSLMSLLIPFHRIWRPLSIPLYFCVLNLAVLFALFEIARGREFVHWQPIRR